MISMIFFDESDVEEGSQEVFHRSCRTTSFSLSMSVLCVRYFQSHRARHEQTTLSSDHLSVHCSVLIVNTSDDHQECRP